MYRVQYFCPRQSPYWQEAGFSQSYEAALVRAQVVKPPRGAVRILDPYNNVVAQF